MAWRILTVSILICFQAFILDAAKHGTYTLVADSNGRLKLLPKDNTVWRVSKKDESGFVARAEHNDSISETGWYFLEIKTNQNYSDKVQAYSAGFIEGAVTHDLIYQHWFNTLGDFCTGRDELCQKIDQFVNNNLKWIEESTKRYAEDKDYWHQVSLFYEQIRGLADGYSYANADPKTNLTYKDLLWLNLQGDFEDLVEVFQAQKSNFQQQGPHKIGKVLGKNGRCSALIKVLPDGSDLFVAQDTWSSYQSMLRSIKKYDFGFHTNKNSKELINGKTMTFSSYPGVITSGDDFYVISSGLVTLETTIGNGNSSLWRFVEPIGQVSEGVRAMVANRIAKSGRTWTKIFGGYNSGTYNNQWMIVDYTKFKKSTKPKDLTDDVLWVLEQIPGYIHTADMTSVLRNYGYWPSYNVAFFPDVFNMSGNLPLVDKFGDWFTYERNPRALIFKREHGKISDLKSMFSLMRYNDYMHDPLSKCDCNPPYSAENTIAARSDLNPASGTYPFPALGHRSHGATDAKITSQELFLRGLQFLAVSGPPYNESLGIPPFQWSTADFEKSTPHLGHPDLWTFSPIIHEW